jgi:hypothetical protein
MHAGHFHYFLILAFDKFKANLHKSQRKMNTAKSIRHERGGGGHKDQRVIGLSAVTKCSVSRPK